MIQKSSLDWGSGPGTLGHKNAKTCPHYEVTHKPQNQFF